VLIRGESGTGKGLLARAIHDASARAGKPFVMIHCAALAPGLLESELFGHVRGAFTGAVRDKVGRFEVADGGTLFLDEVGDISPDVQTKLLRVLQEKTFERVGSSDPVQVDVRLVAATHQNLEQLIRQSRFREDLFYRLNVITLTVPPLRDRPDDIPLLVEHFARQFAGGRKLDVSREEIERLRHHTWPGNVRELRNVIERACALTHGDQLEIDEAFDEKVSGAATGTVNIELPFKEAKAQIIDNFEREYIRTQLKRHEGNLSAAARAAEVDRKHFRELLRKHGLRESSE
jgi:DNA-binding NtrC family response regulator